jgi:SprT-like family protein
MAELDATDKNYSAWRQAYGHFNVGLFNSSLPGCLLTFQRQRDTYGFHAGFQFESSGSRIKADEIALNPRHFAGRTVRDVLATLVHEMVHQHQHRFGKPSPRGYHNKGWARKMIAIGLIPSDTGKPGGKATGRRVHHYVRTDGPFDRLCAELLNAGFAIPYVEVNFLEEIGVPTNAEELETRNFAQLQKQRAEELRKKKAASKSRYTCPGCDVPKHVWGKPGLHVICGECSGRFEADAADDGWLAWPELAGVAEANSSTGLTAGEFPENANNDENEVHDGD